MSSFKFQKDHEDNCITFHGIVHMDDLAKSNFNDLDNAMIRQALSPAAPMEAMFGALEIIFRRLREKQDKRRVG